MSVPANHFDSYTIVASPAGATETVIASVSGVGELLPGLTVHLDAWANVTKEASAVDAILAIRRGSLTGTVVAGPVSMAGAVDAGADGVSGTLQGFDAPGDFAGATYVLTLTMTSAGGASTVVAVGLHARTS